jgi:hypothetical protein
MRMSSYIMFNLPNYHGTSFDSEGHYSHNHSNATLPLFGPEVLLLKLE